MKCVICDDLIEVERMNLGFTKCKGCAFLHPEAKVLVALVCITGMKLGLSAGKDGVKADVERDDEPLPHVVTTTTTEVKP